MCVNLNKCESDVCMTDACFTDGKLLVEVSVPCSQM